MQYYGLNLLRGIAAFGIVGCHLGLSQRTPCGEWVTALCNFNVGLFAAISGFLMTVGGEGYVKKRAKRILPTYLVWSAFYIVATAVFDLVLDGGHLNERYYSLSNWLNVLFCGSSATHLWFLICLFYAQAVLHGVCVAFDKLNVKDNVKKMVMGFTSVALLCCSITWQNWYCLYLIRLMAFLLLGYLMKDYVKRDRFILPLGCTVVVLAIHLGTRGLLPGFLRDYLLVVPVVMLFVSDRFGDRKTFTFLAATSMGVYLIHPLFARAMSFVVMRFVSPPYNAFVVLGEWMVIWVVSLISVTVIMRMPVVKKFVR